MIDHIDPNVGIPLALALWAVLGALTLADRRKARRRLSTVAEVSPDVHVRCEVSGCRHRCGECRLGLGIHKPCDPLCEAAR